MSVPAKFKVPEAVAPHKHKLVKAGIEMAELLYAHRDHLDEPITDQKGNVLYNGHPALRQALAALDPNGSPKILKRRRADFMQGLLSTMLVGLAYASYRSKAILSSRYQKPGHDPFMSLLEWEDLAELLPAKNRKGGEGCYTKAKRIRQLADGTKAEVEIIEAGDRIERYTSFLRDIKVLHTTKQNRDKLADGRCRSAGAGLRRVAWTGIYAFGGRLGRLAKRMQDHARRKEKKDREDQAVVDEALRLQFAAQERARLCAEDDDSLPEPEPAPPPRLPGQPDPRILDDVHNDHPTWSYPEIAAEARRLEAKLATGAAAGDDDTS